MAVIVGGEFSDVAPIDETGDAVDDNDEAMYWFLNYLNEKVDDLDWCYAIAVYPEIYNLLTTRQLGDGDIHLLMKFVPGFTKIWNDRNTELPDVYWENGA